jgi:predicted helicase
VPSSPFYFFVPRQEEERGVYESYPRINEIFPVGTVGIVTGRDHFTIGFSAEEMWSRILSFSGLDPELARVSYRLGKDSRDWTVATALADVSKSGPSRELIRELLFRPFDLRQTYYTGNSRGFYSSPQSRIMSQFQFDNIGLILPKRVETKGSWQHLYVTSALTDHVAVSLKTIDYCFPLYVGPDAGKLDLFSKSISGARDPNLALQLLTTLTSAHKKRPVPEDVFNYIYAILSSNYYRQKYTEFLKTDFPRVPFTKNALLFRKVAEKGSRLVELHLLRSAKLTPPIAKCEGSGTLDVAKVVYDPKRARVHINPDKYFTGVSTQIWEYRIGGYQVPQKWLKDRKGRTLSSEEVATYAKIITALAETMKIQESLDDLFKAVESSLLKVNL